MQIQKTGQGEAGGRGLSAPSGEGNSKTFVSRGVSSRAGYNYFKQKGDNTFIAGLKTFYNFTVARLIPRGGYFIDRQPSVRPADMPTEALENSRVDIKGASGSEDGDYSYSEARHKGAVMVTGVSDESMDKFLNRMAGTPGQASRKNFNGVEPHTISIKDSKLPFYKLDMSAESVAAADNQMSGWQLKIKNAGACLVCISLPPGSEVKTLMESIASTVGQLQPAKNGLPDMSRVRFVLTDADTIYDQLGKKTFHEYVSEWKNSITDHLKMTFGDKIMDVSDEMWMVSGKGDGDYLTDPHDIMTQLSDISPDTE